MIWNGQTQDEDAQGCPLYTVLKESVRWQSLTYSSYPVSRVSQSRSSPANEWMWVGELP